MPVYADLLRCTVGLCGRCIPGLDHPPCREGATSTSGINPESGPSARVKNDTVGWKSCEERGGGGISKVSNEFYL